MKTYASIDIGGTAIKYGLVDEAGAILKRFECETRAEQGGPGILRRAAKLVRELSGEADISGICISTAGMVDVEKGEIFYAAPLIPDYAGTRFKETMEQTFGLPCEVENDVNCAGLAEASSGAAKGSSVAVCLTVGTGIGGCIILDGRVFRGFSNSACEVGYMQMLGSDFQTLGAGSILSKKVAQEKGENLKKWSGRRIFAAARKGDPVCIRAIDRMAEVLGMGIANICCVLNPQIVVLGGGIMAQEDILKPKIRACLDRYLVSSIAKKTNLVMAEYKNDAGMVGALYHFKNMQAERKQERGK